MAFATTDDGVRLFHRVEGPEGAPPLLLSNSLGTDHMMCQQQAEALRKAWLVVRYDQRGHGASEAPAGPYSLDRLGRDALVVADHLGLETFSFCGLSMGGLTGLWLAIHAGRRIGRLAVASTGAWLPPAAAWDERIAAVRERGLVGIVDFALARFFSDGFRRAEAITLADFRRTFLATLPDGYIGCCCALRDADLRTGIKAISVPTLVIAGAQDPATPPEYGASIAKAVPGARLVVLDGAHIVNVEQPAAFNREPMTFLA